MDVEYPFASGLSRLQLLYRLPSAPAPRRLLVVVDDAEGDLIGPGWGGPVTWLSSSALEQTAMHGEARFDVVALPGTLDADSPDGLRAEPLLRAAHRLLVAGGAVVGHLENMLTLRRLAHASNWPLLVQAATRRGVLSSAPRCIHVLRRCGFDGPECYYVQPSTASPMGLIPCDYRPARAQFRRSLGTAGAQYGHLAYAARWLLAFAGLGGMQQPQLFFWANKTC